MPRKSTKSTDTKEESTKNIKNAITSEGLKKLEDELNNLKINARRDIAEKIKEARSQGDISENAEYDSALNEQMYIEARIKELEETLNKVVLVDADSLKVEKGVVNIGSEVTVFDEEYNENLVFVIVGSIEANSQAGKISNESPLGKALMGHVKGDVVDVVAPAGVIKYRIEKVENNK